LGASRILLTVARGQLSMEADLGGVQRMSRFVTLFPLVLCLALFALVRRAVRRVDASGHRSPCRGGRDRPSTRWPG